MLARREQFHRQAMGGFYTLAETYVQKGDLQAALPYARRQVELEPWHEPGQQQLMRLLALSGQRSAALAQYEAFRKALADELNVEASAETKRLYEAIRDEKIEEMKATTREPLSPPVSESRPSHNLPLELTSFIGRQHEISQVQELLRENRQTNLGLLPRCWVQPGG